ncbi:MAG: hypothetical protein JEZ14_25020 [Marinilabiliaceae bacterium]|nr:hypothetical protein [Marinilabiliaceae bacterium]
MNTAELKLKIFRQIDRLDKNKLKDIYGLLTNYINGQQDSADWDKLSSKQKNGIYQAIDELDKAKQVLNEKVIPKV